ncbi:MAG: hypothetical protein ACRET0_11870 [Steroidobacteraceae bacterium]
MNEATPSVTIEPSTALARCRMVRADTEDLVAALSPEDQCVPSMPDARPAKWHRAPTTCFFEEFVLGPFLKGYQVFDRDFRLVFNSYYDSVDPRHPRPIRGSLTRPSAEQIGHYRQHVDAAMEKVLAIMPDSASELIELGLQHEQQHQELLLTDMMHAFSHNPLASPVLPGWHEPVGTGEPTKFVAHDGGSVRIGHADSSFCFDNEEPVYTVFLRPREIATRGMPRRVTPACGC